MFIVKADRHAPWSKTLFVQTKHVAIFPAHGEEATVICVDDDSYDAEITVGRDDEQYRIAYVMNEHGQILETVGTP